ncbi:signal peptidase I [Patescibacteria group bacterium]|nr:signal peptidase I [Patescibacteria group bacterium]
MLQKVGYFLLDILEVVGVSFIIIVVLNVFVLQPNEVSGLSMYPYLQDKDRLITEKITYRFGLPQRGDIVVFRYPLNKKEEFIKRVIALPGEKIEVKNGKTIIYNSVNPKGAELDESYLSYKAKTRGKSFLKEGLIVEVPKDSYAVFGDNRENSSDSRQWGFIQKTDIVGKALVRVWPIETFKILKDENKYFEKKI